MNSNMIYDNIIKAHNFAPEKHIPVKSKSKQHVPWLSEDIVEKRKALLEAQECSNRLQTRARAKEEEKARSQPKEASHKEQQKYLTRKDDELKSAAEKR